MQPGVGQHGQKEHADELGVGEPERLLGVEAGDREDVDEDGLCALKEDVERGRVLEDPVVLDEVAAEGEGGLGGGEPERGGPLPGIGDEGDAGVLEQDAGRASASGSGWAERQDRCCRRQDQAGIALLRRAGRERGGEEGEDLLSLGGADGAVGAVGAEFEAAGGITKGLKGGLAELSCILAGGPARGVLMGSADLGAVLGEEALDAPAEVEEGSGDQGAQALEEQEAGAGIDVGMSLALEGEAERDKKREGEESQLNLRAMELP